MTRKRAYAPEESMSLSLSWGTKVEYSRALKAFMVRAMELSPKLALE
jgi:hypothetical protein